MTKNWFFLDELDKAVVVAIEDGNNTPALITETLEQRRPTSYDEVKRSLARLRQRGQITHNNEKRWHIVERKE